MIFIRREDRNIPDYNKPAVYRSLHIAEREFKPHLPKWRKMPACRNGGLDLGKWSFYETDYNEDPTEWLGSHICRSCLECARRMRDQLEQLILDEAEKVRTTPGYVPFTEIEWETEDTL